MKTQEQITAESSEILGMVDHLTGYYKNQAGTKYMAPRRLEYDEKDQSFSTKGECVNTETLEDGTVLNRVAQDATLTKNQVSKLVKIEKAEFEQAMENVFAYFEDFAKEIYSKGYLFKFDEADAHDYRQLLGVLNAAETGKFPVYFYYAPTEKCFCVVKILPEWIEVRQEHIEGGETERSVTSAKYMQHQLTMDSNKSNGSNRNLTLVQFKRDEVSADAEKEFAGYRLYLISTWHYEQILGIIKKS